MRLIVLNDEKPGKCPAEHGLSFLLDCGEKILFDAGPSGIFAENAKALGIDLGAVGTIVLSHGHWDHTNGLAFISDKRLVCHPDCFARRFRKKDNQYNGPPITLAEAKKRFDLVLSAEPFNITTDVIFLGEIPRLNGFEAQTTEFYLEGGADDFIMGDSALAIKTPKGLVVVSGCSHSGICNIIEYAKKVSGVQNVHSVIGGFHLSKLDNAALRTIKYFKDEKIQIILPSHCTCDAVIERMSREMNVVRVHSGDSIEI